MSQSPLPVPHVCTLLNKHAAKYIIVDAQASILHGYVRDTHDIDILIPEDSRTTPASSPR